MTAPQLPLPGAPPAPHSAQAQRRRAKGGSRAEQHAKASHQAQQQAGVAEVHKVCSNVTILKHLGGGRVLGQLTEKSVVDCMGWMADGTGRAIALEVKHVDVGAPLRDGSPRAWRFPLAQLEDHQRAMLDRAHAAGAVALLLVVHGAELHAVPWPVVAEALDAGQASLSAEQLEPHRCRPGEPYLARWALWPKELP